MSHNYDEEPPPEVQAALNELIAEKRRTLVGWITLNASFKPGMDRDEHMRLVDEILPDLVQPVIGMGPAALNRASMDVIMHLLRKLTEARGEPIDVTWQREAVELMREDGQRG